MSLIEQVQIKRRKRHTIMKIRKVDLKGSIKSMERAERGKEERI